MVRFGCFDSTTNTTTDRHSRQRQGKKMTCLLLEVVEDLAPLLLAPLLRRQLPRLWVFKILFVRLFLMLDQNLRVGFGHCDIHT